MRGTTGGHSSDDRGGFALIQLGSVPRPRASTTHVGRTQSRVGLMRNPHHNVANDNHRTWLEGIVDRYPWRLVIVSFVLSVFTAVIVFSALAKMFKG